MQNVVSKDGTLIAYDKTGEGPAVLLVDSAMCYRRHWGGGSLAAELAKDWKNLDGQTHQVSPEALAPELVRFFKA